MKRHNREPQPQPRLEYHRHDNERWRVWNTNWYGDQFEIVTDKELATLKAILPTYGIHICEAKDGDE